MAIEYLLRIWSIVDEFIYEVGIKYGIEKIFHSTITKNRQLKYYLGRAAGHLDL